MLYKIHNENEDDEFGIIENIRITGLPIEEMKKIVKQETNIDDIDKIEILNKVVMSEKVASDLIRYNKMRE